MLVVPLPGDRILVNDTGGQTRTVSSYTSLKKEPAVYVDSANGVEVVLFSQIGEINGVKVEMNRSAKVFEALGPLRRKYNLPQPGDEVTVDLEKVPDEVAPYKFKVKHLKLHNKAEGITNGLMVCDEQGCYKLTDIRAIDRMVGEERFDYKGFKRYYFHYLPLHK